MSRRNQWMSGSKPPSRAYAGHESGSGSVYSYDLSFTPEWDQYDGGDSRHEPPARCGWLAGARRRLRELSKLSDDWDGEGGLPPSGKAIAEAGKYIGHLAAECRVSGPTITPTPVGGVLVAWRNGAYRLEITFSVSGLASFAFLNTGSQESDRGDVSAPDDRGRLDRLLTSYFGA